MISNSVAFLIVGLLAVASGSCIEHICSQLLTFWNVFNITNKLATPFPIKTIEIQKINLLTILENSVYDFADCNLSRDNRDT